MKKVFFALIALCLVFFSASALAHTEQNPFEAKLLACRHSEAGVISVWNDSEFVYVKYSVFEGWAISETHLAASVLFEGIPQTKTGNPVVGKFQFHEDYNPKIQEDVFAISLEQLGAKPGQEIFLAAHAVVSGGEKGCNGSETAWAEGLQFPGKNWAMFFPYKVQGKLWKLPETPVIAEFHAPGTGNSYNDPVLSNVPEGFDVFNGTWPGWCVDLQHVVYTSQLYPVMLFSSYDPLLGTKCAYCANGNWDLVNYTLNHKANGSAWEDIQDAIWHFIGGGGYPTRALAVQMVEDALANGEGFVPTSGQIGAVILDAGPTNQLTIIEVDP